MELLLNFYIGIFSSTGFSILLLSFSFALLLAPLQHMALRIEERVGSKINTVEAEVEPLKVEFKGEALFLATEKVYKKHDYHPIQSIAMGASFFVMLPVLVSAILLLTGDQLAGVKFMLIKDLSMPDGLLGPVNLLPLLMSAITVVDARLRFKDDPKSQYRFFFISFVLLILVYNLAAGLVLYWTGSNILSLVVNRIKSK
ncbi:MAG: membrane protein insertase Oxa1/YidC/SpoIIIJ [Gammaproteobacteria bacterium]|jgi:membrane protein insertase Oxa1/YidC/SpoIIIJ